MKVVEFNDIHRAYQRGHDVLKGVRFSIEKGEVVGLLGKNGAGKTTLMRIAMGMLEPQAGSVRLFGLDPRESSVEVKRRVGYVSEDQILPPFFKIGQILDMHRSLFPNWDDELARSLCERFELAPDRKIKSLSKGQARRVALVCAVSHRPELLLLDEPAGGLDPAARREFLETSIRLLNETGTTILFSSHHMADVERVAGRVVMIHAGCLLLDHALDELREAFCLALVPDASDDSAPRLRKLETCLTVRERGDGLHAILQLDPERGRDVLERELGIRDARCTTIALEDMFVELVGGA
jgi:ABC-2 type transport system ATP-binding protein